MLAAGFICRATMNKERRRFDAAHISFFVSPASNDQMLANARQSFFENAGADFVSLNFLPRSVERRTLHAEEGIAARRVETRNAARVDQCRIDGYARPERPTECKSSARLRGLGHEETFSWYRCKG